MFWLHGRTHCARGQSVILKEWLKNSTGVPLPDPSVLTPVEMSKILSTITVQKLLLPDNEYWTKTIGKLTQSVRSSPSITSYVSCLHILDRIASFGVIQKDLDNFLRCIVSANHKVSAMDGFIGARALLLLGWSKEIPFCTSTHLKSMSNANLTILAQLATSCGNEKFGSLVANVLSEKLSVSKNLNSFSTTDLINAVVSVVHLPRLGGRKELSSSLKSCATELVRRIELGFVSPHSCVRLVEIFSGSPPAPIHPLLLQACFAFLLENWNYKLLCRDEISRLLHACILSEIENIVLTPILVREFVTLGNRGCLGKEEDPRISLRMMAAISLSKATIDGTLVHAVSRGVCVSKIKSLDDASILATAFLNSLYNGACLSKVDEFLSSDLVNHLIESSDDVEDMATLALLSSASRRMSCFCGVPSNEEFPRIPQAALEITGKSNPALPRNDLKKKRLAKRIKIRGESIFDQSSGSGEERTFCSQSSGDPGMNNVTLVALLRCADLMVDDIGVYTDQNSLAPTDRLSEKAKSIKTDAENRNASLDIISSLVFSCEHILDSRDCDELEQILRLVEVCTETLSDHPSKLPMEERDGIEESVRSHLKMSSHSVDSPIRISIVL
jgi:hypothetical protein